MTIYHSDSTGDPKNTSYPNKVEADLSSTEDLLKLKAALSHDYTASEFAGGVRSKTNFLKADCVILDVDNDHSNDPQDWITENDLARAFPGVSFAVHHSRSHMISKNGKAPRPKFHAIFEINPTTDATRYNALKRHACEVFPYFDNNALDEARFFFGTTPTSVEIYPGTMTLDEYLDTLPPPTTPTAIVPFPSHRSVSTSVNTHAGSDEDEVIPEGARNSEMYRYACSVLYRHGDSDKAVELFFDRSEICDPPLTADELGTIWEHAVAHYQNDVCNQEDYIPSAVYNQPPAEVLRDFTNTPGARIAPPSGATSPPAPPTGASSGNSGNDDDDDAGAGDAGSDESLKPDDYSHVGEAIVLKRKFGDRLRYTSATHYLCYNEDAHFWEESGTKARTVIHKFTELQERESSLLVDEAETKMKKNGAWYLLRTCGKTKARSMMSDEQLKSHDEYLAAQEYYDFVIKMRNTKNLDAVLTETAPMVEIPVEELDKDGFLLCTPSGTYDLHEGLQGKRESLPEDYCTKITSVSPSDDGKPIWLAFLDTVFCGNGPLIKYVQLICGIIALGIIRLEALIIAYGSGRNGKSTLFNAIARILGTYAGSVAADILTYGCRRNTLFGVAELRGRRFAIASELPEGAMLNDGMVKQLCSTDKISAEKKYKDPFDFTPTHTLVLYTNHLPRVRASDDGIWRRLIVIPFEAKIEGSSDIKNYADYLYENAGGAILSWIIEGAKEIIDLDYHLPVPDCVQKAIADYRGQNDWLAHFIEDTCDTDPSYSVSSSDLYLGYLAYCDRYNEYRRNKADFYRALDCAGYAKFAQKKRSYIRGLQLKSYAPTDDIADSANTGDAADDAA